MTIRTLLFTVLLGLASTVALGATPAPATSTGPDAMKSHGMCAKDPDQCKQLASKFDQWCKADAQKCTDLKAHIEKRREWCERNQPKCRAIRRRMRAHFQERHENTQNSPGTGAGTP